MARPVVLQDAFSLGMKRDVPRNRLPRNACWNLVDYIPDILGAPLRKRGGYSYASNDISAVKATASYVLSVKYAEFSAATKIVIHDEDGELYTVTPGSLTVTDVGASLVVAQNPTFYRNIVIITDGTNAPKKYDGSAIATLGATAPSAKYSSAFKDFGVLARTSTNTNRVYFSGAGDPTTWDTTNSYIDAVYPVTALAPLSNMLLVFSTGHCERIRGSVPPPDTDMVRETLFDIGVNDPWSIVSVGDSIVFANTMGVYQTDGTASQPLDLTEAGGIKSYWRDLLASYTSSYTLSAGFYRGLYIIAIMNGSTFVDCLACDVSKRVWFRFANFKARAFTQAFGAAEELYFGLRSAPRVASASSLFNPTSSVKNDADGTAVAPVYESPFYLSPGKKTWKAAYLSHDTRDSASDNPTQTISYLKSPESTSYTALSSVPDETTARTRDRAYMRFSAEGVGFKVAQTNASSDTRLYSLEVDTHGRESSRL